MDDLEDDFGEDEGMMFSSIQSTFYGLKSDI